jgi:hypothetical protein
MQHNDQSTVYTLPEVGTDWLSGLQDCYVIYSIKRSEPGNPQFWTSGGFGYATIFSCGVFTKTEILGNIWRFNDGLNAVAIPLTFTALETLGFVFKITIDEGSLIRFLNVAGSATKPVL